MTKLFYIFALSLSSKYRPTISKKQIQQVFHKPLTDSTNLSQVSGRASPPYTSSE